jgi:hypothetical protein
MHLKRLAALAATIALAVTAPAWGGKDDTAAVAAPARPAPVTEIPSLSGTVTPVTLDASFEIAITGGNVTYYEPGTVSPYVQGMIAHDDSGLSLAGGGKTVELTDFAVDPGKSVLTGKVTVDGQVAAESAPLFFLDGRTLNPLETNDHGTAVLDGTTVKLRQEAADLLNQTFGVDALTAGLVIGVAKITINTA